MNIVLGSNVRELEKEEQLRAIRTYLQTALITSDIKMAHLDATAARFGFSSPSRLPILMIAR